MNRGITVAKAAVLVLAILFGGSSAALAAGQSGLEKLLDAAPDDVLAIAGTSGGGEIGPAFKETVISKMWHDQQTQAFYTQVRDIIVGKIQAEAGPKDANAVADLLNTASFLLERPCVAGVAARPAGDEQVPAYFFVLVNAGPVKDEFAAKLKKLEAEADLREAKEISIGGYKMQAVWQPDDPVAYWGMQGDYFILAVNDRNGLALKHLKDAGSSAAALLGKVPGNGDAFSTYIDVARVKALLQSQVGSEEEYAKVKAFMKSMGLDTIRSYVARTGFIGGEITSESFVDVPQPRTGIMAAVKPINMKVFDMVDANCIAATAINLDAATVFDTVMNSVKTVDQEAYEEVMEGLADFETESGIRVRDGIIASLAGPVTFYSLPGGPMDMTFGGSVVIIADLKDQAKFEQNMAALGAFITKESNGSLQISVQTLGDRKLNVWTVPQMAMVGLSPTWTVVNGKLVFATSQQMCKTAADRVASPDAAKSISSRPLFRSATADIPAGATSVRYLDSRVYFKTMMNQLQRAWPMATMAASQGGVALPFVLPDLSQYESQMKPGVACSWSDKEGIHTRVKGSGIEQAVGSVAGCAMGAAILMPALSKARDLGMQISSGTNLKTIANGILIYAQDHNERYPKELAELTREADLDPKTLESKNKPKGFDGPSYIYVAGLTSVTPGNCIVVYENPAFCNDKVNVLYNDMHVELVDKAKFRADLKKTYERLGKPMPDVKFMGEGNSSNGKKTSTKPAEPNKP